MILVQKQLKTTDDCMDKVNDPTVQAAWLKTFADLITFSFEPPEHWTAEGKERGTSDFGAFLSGHLLKTDILKHLNSAIHSLSRHLCGDEKAKNKEPKKMKHKILHPLTI